MTAAGSLQRFFIFFYHRSGSTHFVSLLDSHPQIDCRMEVFHLDWSSANAPARIPRFSTPKKSREWLDSFFYSSGPRPPLQARGFKFKYPVQYRSYPEVWEYLMQNEFKVIHLYRQNSLKVALSEIHHRIFRNTPGRSNVVLGGTYAHRKLHVNVGELRARIAHHKTVLAWSKQLLRDAPGFVTLRYEDLVLHPHRTLNEACAYLGVSPKMRFHSSILKMTPDNLKDAVENFEEVVEALRGTEDEAYLDP